jgi:hypothetical protein
MCFLEFRSLYKVISKHVGNSSAYLMGAYQIVAGWCGHQPGRAAVVGVHTDHSNQTAATIWDAPYLISFILVLPAYQNNFGAV